MMIINHSNHYYNDDDDNNHPHSRILLTEVDFSKTYPTVCSEQAPHGPTNLDLVEHARFRQGLHDHGLHLR